MNDDATGPPTEDTMDETMKDFLEREANIDQYGRVALAHLRRKDEDEWDLLVVDRNNLPLMFWSTGDSYSGEDAVRNEEGHVLMVLTSTPPGVTPSGLIAMPADEHGSPKGRLVSLVQADEMVMVGPSNKPPSAKGQARLEASMLHALLAKSAKRSGTSYYTAVLEAADGGQVPVIVDWDGRPIMFWIDLPAEQSGAPTGDPTDRGLFTAAVAGEGMVAVAVDLSLRPTKSGEGLLPPPTPG